MVSSGIELATVFVLAAALLIDRLIGDPHTPFHPVALIGRFIGFWGRAALYPPVVQRFVGVFFWCGTILLFAFPFLLFSHFAPELLYLAFAPFLLKCCFAWRALEEHAASVVVAVGDGVESGRESVRQMVSRDTAGLDREHILSAAYESLTENITDSIVSPLLFYGFFGLAGAAVYRAANTMDAMLGYRDERERIGWFSARMDDVLTLIPARVTATLLLVYFAAKGRFSPAYTIMRRDGRRRPGFNGGIIMAAMAGGAGVRFEKPGVYTIGDPIRSLDDGGPEIFRAVRSVTLMAAGLTAMVAFGTLFLLGTWINNIGI